MDQQIVAEVLRTGALGFALAAPLRYYLLRYHAHRPGVNTAVITLWGMAVGYLLFEDSRTRLANTKRS